MITFLLHNKENLKKVKMLILYLVIHLRNLVLILFEKRRIFHKCHQSFSIMRYNIMNFLNVYKILLKFKQNV